MTFLDLSQTQWTQIAISAGIVIAALILTKPLLTFLLDRVIGRITSATHNTLDNYLIAAIRPPLFWLVIAICFDISLGRLSFLITDIQGEIDIAFYLIYSTLTTITIWRLIGTVAEWYTATAADKTDTPYNQIVPFVSRIARILLIGIAAIIILDHFDVEVSGLLATLGIGSLAIALAAQAALSDTISGIMIMLDRPFRIGDRIEIMELDTWGDVEDIGLRSTRIRTRDNRMVVVPNSVISKSLVVNYAYPNSEYRIEIHVGVAYGTDLEFARKTLVEAVSKVDGVDTRHPVEALFLEFGDSALIFRVRWWLDSYVDTRRMFDKVNTAMYNALNQAGIEIPYPQQDLNVRINQDSGKSRLSLQEPD
ncbi:MAG: mechanosensitive ion channel [Anaerolineales bacterium]|nr:mechanosensitive ion channel [Anaerolineales bacterium]